MTRLPRDDILARTDLGALADELLGPRRGHGATVTWSCPSHQPQTGRSPPVSIFVTSRGEQRWHCHACGAGGTAIDLLVAACGMNVRAALEALAARASLEPRVTPAPPRPSPPARGLPVGPVSGLVRDHVERCARLLWTERGRPVREWLHGRGLHDATLRHHQVGADPGPRHLDRPRGLPRRGPAAILPARDARGDVVYFQARYLDPARADGPKYDNPARAVAANPRLATLDPLGVARSGTRFVCEGLPDGLSISQAGHRAVALLGVGLAGPAVADRLHADHPGAAIRVVFDADARGVDARETLLRELHDRGHPDATGLVLPAGVHDANDWLRCDPVGFAAGLDAAAPGLAIDDPGVALEL